ncbi:PIN domain-like protein [Pavlovales sp. CCMP2436]|nr:PIN domain-like protein [Pavlovales sp. CCMP2436]|mmetsp:Transcript_12293/g.31007  ORF Transcript_12293/g.31007 Transcript_12293/m.31007 type:complete len:398 (+) Transcript_12293:87-1280(+)
MGIHGLSKLIADHAPGATKEGKFENYFGRKIAIDATMSIYQFLVAVRQEENSLTNAEGVVTSHLNGMFYRTIKMIDAGIKPVYVFDGKPPTMKGGELAKRQARAAEAHSELAKAKESGDQELIEKFSKRTVRASRQQSEDCKKLLTLMGVPVIDAPCEAESTCAALAMAGKVFAVGTEDMDALTFGSTVMLRHLTYADAKKVPPMEYRLADVLSGLELTMDQFIDVCILCGCDYTDKIKGVGPETALKKVREYGSLAGLLASSDKLNAEDKVPQSLRDNYQEVQRLFTHPDVIDAPNTELKWSDPDVEGVVAFMVTEMGFDEKRIRSGLEKLQKAKGKGNQGRIESFFKAQPPPAGAAGAKRKEAPGAKGKGGAAGKGAAAKKSNTGAKPGPKGKGK